jgi:thiol-disulfide isomerase/thioredoxin
MSVLKSALERGLLLLSPALVVVLASLLPGCSASESPPVNESPATADARANLPESDSNAPEGSGSRADSAADAESDAPVAGGEPAVAADAPPIAAIKASELIDIMNKTRGKVTVLNIWATWCGPCVQEMPDLVTFYNETDREALEFVSLSLDEPAEIDTTVRAFQQKFKVPFPIHVLSGRDDAGMNTAIRGEFDGMIPTTYIYDKSGALVNKIMGAVPLAALREQVQPLL